MTTAVALPDTDLVRHRGGIGPPRLTAGPGPGITESLASHRARLGGPWSAAERRPPSHFIEEIRRSGLSGRGGGGFPVAEKLAAVARHSGLGYRAVVVANACESEPASAKDRLLTSARPHLVIDGIELAARAVGARRAFICVSPRSDLAMGALGGALEERRKSDSLAIPVEMVAGAPQFVGGDETALLRWIAGGAPKPTLVPPLPAEKGLRGRPTLVQNAETLANLALISRFGADWFRRSGTAEEPGTMLITVSGSVARPGVYETPIGVGFQKIFAVGGVSEETESVLVGGYFGTWVKRQHALRSVLSRTSLRGSGASPGAGVILALPASACGIRETARVVGWLAGESAGQCGPCVRGLPAVSACLTQLASPATARRADVERLARWCGEIEGRGACRHPDGVVKLVRSCLGVFAAEVEAHRRGGCAGSSEWWLPLPPNAKSGR